jgi:hypothetical protein
MDKMECPKCSNQDLNFEEVSEGYFCACLECDEDFYKIEVTNGGIFK